MHFNCCSKNAFLSRYTDEKRKGGNRNPKKELIYRKSFSSGDYLESFHIG